MNETDRTIVALLWHENVADVFPKLHPPPFTFYYQILQNMCFADYIDRITFQNQVWVFNEMSSLIKTFYNQMLLRAHIENPPFGNGGGGDGNAVQIKEIRFTKVLTKYSTEYNNSVFLYNLTQELQLDKRDVFSLFQQLRISFGETFFNHPVVIRLFEKTEVNKLDLRRMSRFLQKNIKTATAEDTDETDEIASSCSIDDGDGDDE
jgi:hypothetical protein